MKQKVKFEIEVDVTRLNYYLDASRSGCRRCVLYSVCSAIQNMQERFPYSFIRLSTLPCHEGVTTSDREYFKFSSK